MNQQKEKADYKELNQKSLFLKVRKRLYEKLYCFQFRLENFESRAGIPASGHVYREVQNEAELLQAQQAIERYISPEKFKSVYQRYVNPERISSFFFLYTPGGEFCGYTELVTESFFDNALNTTICVEPGTAFCVDLYVFKPYRSHRVGAQIIRIVLFQSRKLGYTTLYGLINENNPASLRNAHHMGGVVVGCLYQFFPARPRWYIQKNKKKNGPKLLR